MPELTELELLALQFPRRKYSPRLLPVDVIPGEEWRAIPRTNDIYYVSNMGRVKKEFVLKSGKYISALLKPFISNNKQFVGLTLRPKYVVKRYIANLVLMAFKPMEGQERKYPLFKDGDCTNCKLENLEWSSKNATSRAMMENGFRTRKLQTKQYMTRTGKIMIKMVQFTPKEYEKMKEMYAAGISQIRIAKEFKCTQGFISLVCSGKLK